LVAELRDTRPAGAAEFLRRLGRRIVEGADRDPAAVRMVLHCREERYLDERSRESAREFRTALQGIVAAGKSDGVIRAGPAELWASLWLAMVGFAAERVSSREWGLEHPQLGLALEAAWDAIAAKRSSA
jgi:hypothetical protein